MERAKLLFGGYRKGEANDPDNYVASLVLILSEYPEWVVRSVSDPRTGIQKEIGWLPSMKEIYEACEYRMRDVRRAAHDAFEREQALKNAPIEISDEERARVGAAMKALAAERGEAKRPQSREDAQRAVAGGFQHLQGPLTAPDYIKAARGGSYEERDR